MRADRRGGLHGAKFMKSLETNHEADGLGDDRGISGGLLFASPALSQSALRGGPTPIPARRQG